MSDESKNLSEEDTIANMFMTLRRLDRAEYRLFKRVVRSFVNENTYDDICKEYNKQLQKLRKGASE
jgi:hypothetical protein